MRKATVWMIVLALSFVVTAEAFAQEEPKTITGRVVAVSAKDMTLTIKGEKRGERQTIKLEPGTKITVGGKAATLKDIKRGHNATLRYRMTMQAGEPVAIAVGVPNPTDIVVPAPTPAQTPPVASARPAPPAPAPPARPLPAKLPKTASPLPLVGLVGLLAIALAGGITALRRRGSDQPSR